MDIKKFKAFVFGILFCLHTYGREHIKGQKMCDVIDIKDTHNSSAVYLLLNKLNVECFWPDRGGWEQIDFNGTGTFVCPLKQVDQYTPVPFK